MIQRVSAYHGKTNMVRLNNKFYDLEVVREAVRDFRKICKARIISDEILIEITPKKIEDEFCNYVLGLMKNRSVI